MKPNMGTTDRIIRILAAVAIGVIYYLGLINGVVATVLAIIAVVFILTSLVSFCPLYAPFRFSPKKISKD